MAYKSLRDFIEQLEAEGELVRVTEPVSTHLEMTEIQTRLLRNGGPAVDFEKPVMPDGSISPIPCLANLFGTVKRVAMGVTLGKQRRTTGAELREVGELLAELRNPTPPRDLAGAVEMLPMVQTAMTMRPKVVKTAPVQQIVLKGDRVLQITYSKDKVNAGEVLSAVQAAGLGIVDVSTKEADLEDVFLNLTRGANI